MTFLEIAAACILGGVGYGAVELIWRGHTHWSMLITGGLGFLLLYLIAAVGNLPMWKKWFLGVTLITTVELLAGIVLNLRLGWDIWDYSREPLNLGGQICALYIFYWSLLCIPALSLCSFLRRAFQRLRGQTAFPKQ